VRDQHKGKWHSQPQSGLSKAVTYLRSIGGVAFLFGVGGIILSTYYWFAVATVYIGLVIIFIDLWIERNLPVPWKVGFSITLWALGICGSILYIFPSAPLEIQMIRHRGDFPEGETIGGISWTHNYSELRVSFLNQSEQSYDDVNMLIRTDLPVAKTGFITNPSNCALNLQSNVPELRIKTYDKKTGDRAEYPLFDLSNKAPYQLHCDKLLPHLPVQIVFALVSGKIQNLDKADITKPESIYGDKKLPEFAAVKGGYKVQIRPYTVFKREKLTGD
jgi:hypothetical protein